MFREIYNLYILHNKIYNNHICFILDLSELDKPPLWEDNGIYFCFTLSLTILDILATTIEQC